MLKHIALTAILASSLAVCGWAVPQRMPPGGNGNRGAPAQPRLGYRSAPITLGIRGSPRMSQPNFQRRAFSPMQRSPQFGRSIGRLNMNLPNFPVRQNPRPGPGHSFPPPRMGGPPSSPGFGIGPVPVPTNPVPPVYNQVSYGLPYWEMFNCSPMPLNTVTYVYYYEDVNSNDYPPDYYPYYDYYGYYDGGYSSGGSYSNVQPNSADTQPDYSTVNTAQMQYENWVANQLGISGYQKAEFTKELDELATLRQTYLLTRKEFTDDLKALQADNAPAGELTQKMQEIQNLDTKFQADERTAISNLMAGLTPGQQAKYYSLQSQMAPSKEM